MIFIIQAYVYADYIFFLNYEFLRNYTSTDYFFITVRVFFSTCKSL